MIVFLILISVFRIQQLTASLISKQNILERVTSERTSLAYRLERMEVRTGGLVTSLISSYPQKQVSEVQTVGKRSRRGEETQGQDTAYIEVS